MLKLLVPVFVSLLMGMTLAAKPGFQTKRLNMESYQFTPKTQSQVNTISDFLESFNGYYLQSGRIASNRNVEILFQKEFKNIFQEAMRQVGINYSILYERVKIKMYGDNQRFQRPRATFSLKDDACENMACNNSVNNCCAGYSCQLNPFAASGTCVSDTPTGCKGRAGPCYNNAECCSNNCVPIGTVGSRGLCG